MIKTILNKYNRLSNTVKASFWFLICSFLQKGISAISTPIFTRLMTTAEYGRYDVFNSWLSIVTVFVSLQLYSGVYLQGLVKFEEDRPRFSSSLQGLTTVLTAIGTVIYLFSNEFWNSILGLTTVQVLAMLVMIWSTSAFNLWAGEQRVNFKYKGLVSATLIVSLLKPIIGVIFVINATDKVTARILGLALVELVGYISFFVLQIIRGKSFYSSKYWKYALMFNLPLIPHYLSQNVLNSADRIMIKYYVGASAAGIYGLAYSVSQIMKLFNTALTSTITPYIYQKIKANKINDISKVAYIGLPMIAILNLIMILLAPEIVVVFAPKEYYDAIWVIPPVAMSVYFTFAYDFFAKFSLYYEKTVFVMLASVSGAFLNIVLNAIFIPRFGYYAAGYTTLVCYMVYTGAHYVGMRWVCKLYLNGAQPYNLVALTIITVTFLAVGFIFLFTYKYPLIRYGILSVVFIIAFIKRRMIINAIKGMLALKKKKV